jgi:hypothetical protein
MKHKHHIIPKHAGGTDDPDNLIELSVEEHAEAHRLLYEQYGRWQDRIAWLALSGFIGREEIFKELQKNWLESEESKKALSDRWIKRKENGTDVPWNKGLKKENNPALQKLSEWNTLYREQGKLSNIGDVMRGKEFSQEHKTKLSEIAKNRPKIVCEHCGKSVVKQMYVRFHGEKCKQTK